MTNRDFLATELLAEGKQLSSAVSNVEVTVQRSFYVLMLTSENKNVFELLRREGCCLNIYIYAKYRILQIMLKYCKPARPHHQCSKEASACKEQGDKH